MRADQARRRSNRERRDRNARCFERVDRVGQERFGDYYDTVGHDLVFIVAKHAKFATDAATIDSAWQDVTAAVDAGTLSELVPGVRWSL